MFRDNCTAYYTVISYHQNKGKTKKQANAFSADALNSDCIVLYKKIYRINIWLKYNSERDNHFNLNAY